MAETGEIINPEELSHILETEDLSKLKDEYLNLPFSLLREASILQAKRAIQNSLTPDKNLIQVIEALDEAHSTFNLASERFTTWYSQITGYPRTKLDEIFDNETLPSQMQPLKGHIESTKKLIKELSLYLDEKSPLIFPNRFCK